jgi:hypothetical protein
LYPGITTEESSTFGDKAFFAIPRRDQNSSEGDTSVKGYAIVPYNQGVTEPIKRIFSNCNIKVALKLYLTLGHIFAKPKDLV